MKYLHTQDVSFDILTRVFILNTRHVYRQRSEYQFYDNYAKYIAVAIGFLFMQGVLRIT